jgi:hypothetical protein
LFNIIVNDVEDEHKIKEWIYFKSPADKESARLY